MAQYPAPGVFIEEARHGRRPIESAATSVTGFVGATRKGPLQTPTAVGSFSEYQAAFGPASRESLLSVAVLHYFSNGGRTAVVVSTAHAGKREGARVGGADLVGDEKNETGFHALANPPSGLPSANLLVMPDTASMAPREHAPVIKSALAFCERNRIFYLVDPPLPRTRRRAFEKVIEWGKRNGAARHRNAAVYFPRIETADPSRRSDAMLVPPSGAIAGIYARTDQRRGVWKAPAGTEARLLAVDGAELDLTDAQMRELQRVAINPLRPYPGRGLLVWGARTFADARTDTEWKYVNARRLLLFIEESLYAGLRWSVFEPNGDSLWAEIRLSVSSFMNQLWRRGALIGPSAREAYFVRCGRDTMSQDDIDIGRLVALVGVAPLKPAEFIILRICLPTAGCN